MIDLNNQARDIGIDSSSLLKLYQMFLQSSNQELAVIGKALADKDFSVIEQSAHHITGAARGLELMEIVRFTEEIEKEADAGSLNLIRNSIRQIRAELTKLKNSLDDADGI